MKFLSSKTPSSHLILIMAAGFLIRVTLCFFLKMPHISTDGFFYLNQAQSILEGHFVNYFPNGYPFVISVIILMFGDRNIIPLLLGLNVVLSTAIIFMVYQITRHLSGMNRTALLAALVMAVYPNHLNFVRQILTEITATFFLVCSYLLLYRRRERLSGFVLGFGCVIRTTLLPVLLMMGYARFRSSKRNFKALIFGCIPILIVCTYAYVKSGRFSLSENNKDNLIVASQSIGADINYNIPKNCDIKTTGQALVNYVSGFKKDPGYFLKQRFASLWELWGFFADGYVPGKLDRNVYASIILGMSNAILIVGGFLGVIMYRSNTQVIQLIFPFISITVIHLFLFSTPRFAVPVEPFLIILSSLATGKLLNSSGIGNGP